MVKTTMPGFKGQALFAFEFSEENGITKVRLLFSMNRLSGWKRCLKDLDLDLLIQ